MIKLNPNPTFSAPVLLTVPGEPEPVQITMTFRHMAADKVTEWLANNETRPSLDALAEIITGWDGVQDEEGNEVSFSSDALSTLLNNYRAATPEIVVAWIREMGASRLKN